MTAFANVGLTNTFQTWLTRTNNIVVRLNAFATDELSLGANTVTANNLVVTTDLTFPAASLDSNTYHDAVSITAHAVANSAITNRTLDIGAVGANTKFGATVVTAHALADNSVTNRNMTTGAVTGGIIAASGVNSNTIFSANVISAHAYGTASLPARVLTTGTVGSNTNFADVVITEHAYANTSIPSRAMQTGTVGANTNLAAGVVTAHAIGAGAISANTDFGAGVLSSHAFPNAPLALQNDLQVDGLTFFVDASANSVGFGTITPQAQLHLTRGAVVDIKSNSDSATITLDFRWNNHEVTLGGNRTLGNPANTVPGQSGSIFVHQDITGTRTLSYGSYFKFVEADVPVVDPTASSTTRIDYIVYSANTIHAVASLNVS